MGWIWTGCEEVVWCGCGGEGFGTGFAVGALASNGALSNSLWASLSTKRRYSYSFQKRGTATRRPKAGGVLALLVWGCEEHGLYPWGVELMRACVHSWFD